VNQNIIITAKTQLSYDYGCDVSDFDNEKNIALHSSLHPKRFRYGKEHPDAFKAVTFGFGTVIAASGRLKTFADEIVREYPRDGFSIFSVPCINKIENTLAREGFALSQSLHLAPKKSAKHLLLDFSDSGISVRIYEQSDIRRLLYPLQGFENALSHKFGERTDRLAVCAVYENRVIAAAGASNDSDIMWQIGIDVLPEFRGRGLGSTLVTILTDEITAMGIVPYYSLIPGNVASLKTALACGYTPIYHEMYVV
jgi:GNAT superfamily N-acetyltransferase